MNPHSGDENNDSGWHLLGSAREVRFRPSFAAETAARAARTAQESPQESPRESPQGTAPGFVRLIRLAPAGWQIAAAAVLAFALIIAGVSIVSPSREEEYEAAEATLSPSPFEESFAVEEIDMLLRIENPDALEDEDLLLLLLPDPELL